MSNISCFCLSLQVAEQKQKAEEAEAATRQAKEEAERRVAEATQQITELNALLAAGGGVAAVRNMQVRTMKHVCIHFFVVCT
jgi:hypothetical protein